MFIDLSIPVAFWQFEIILTTVQWVLCLILIIHDITQKRKGAGTVSNIIYTNYEPVSKKEKNIQTLKLSVYYSSEARF